MIRKQAVSTEKFMNRAYSNIAEIAFTLVKSKGKKQTQINIFNRNKCICVYQI